MEELNILHTMDAPIVVFTAGLMEDPHRSVTAWLLPSLQGCKAYVLQGSPYAACLLLLNSMLSSEDHHADTSLWYTCSARGIRDTYRCLFQNSECTKLIGTSRTQEAYSKTLAALSNHRQQQWYAWVKGVMVRGHDLLGNH